MTVDDLDAERGYLAEARRCLDAMGERTGRAVTEAARAVRDENTADARIVEYHLLRRQRALDVAGPVSFGRIDGDDESRFYVGRRHIEDQRGDPVVVDWRAPIAVPFYRATALDPMDLVLRRRFTHDGDELVALFDEHLDDPSSVGAAGIPDPLLAEIERRRTGEMADIVATIAAEQDEIIRAPLDELLIIQGGPGTGKTAVGLHRVAFLLFEHRDRLADDGVLVIGPSQAFLRYIAAVLPSLGETSVVEATIETIYGWTYAVSAEDRPEVGRLKGDLRMAEVVRRVAQGQLKVPTDDTTIPVGSRKVVLSPAEIDDAMATALRSTLPMNEARSVYRRILVETARDRLRERGLTPEAEPAALDALRAAVPFKRLVDTSWPTLSAPALVRRLLGNRPAVRRAAAGLLDPDEVALLQRKVAPKVTDEAWTLAELPLLDEARALVAGIPRRFGHVVVDEAQDLSDMALRMVGRRAIAGSMTILGDLAQATSVAAERSWDEAIAVLGGAVATVPPLHRAELTVGYRVPGPILDLANRLLPIAAPEITPTTSIRDRGQAPLVVQVAEDQLMGAVALEVAELSGRWGSIGVITTKPDAVAAHLARQGLSGDGELAVIDPTTAKGLEFDAVVVVEPAAVCRLENGMRLLYIALTRPVQHLGVIHTEPLPAPLTG